MADVLASASNDINLTNEANVVLVSYYGTVKDGDLYFGERLKSTSWTSATEANKKAALREASELIDRLKYIGTKTDANQNRQFPRGGDTSVPIEIHYATYEIAIKLLAGYDIDQALNNLHVIERDYDTVRTKYSDRVGIPIHLRSGIPSSKAWSYLLPYLVDSNSFKMTRIS